MQILLSAFISNQNYYFSYVHSSLFCSKAVLTSSLPFPTIWQFIASCVRISCESHSSGFIFRTDSEAPTLVNCFSKCLAAKMLALIIIACKSCNDINHLPKLPKQQKEQSERELCKDFVGAQSNNQEYLETAEAILIRS